MRGNHNKNRDTWAGSVLARSLAGWRHNNESRIPGLRDAARKDSQAAKINPHWNHQMNGIGGAVRGVELVLRLKWGGGVMLWLWSCHCYYCCNTLCKEITISDYFVINKHKKRAKHTATGTEMHADTQRIHTLEYSWQQCSNRIS